MMEAFVAHKAWPETGDREDSQANALVKVIDVIALLRPSVDDVK